MGRKEMCLSVILQSVHFRDWGDLGETVASKLVEAHVHYWVAVGGLLLRRDAHPIHLTGEKQ